MCALSREPSALLDTRSIYCGDNIDQLKKLPDACVDLIYIDPLFNSNRNYEVFGGEMISEKRSQSLTETEMFARLDVASSNTEYSKIVDEVYDFGKSLLQKLQERIQRVESKATYFAAYGAAIITLLTSNFSLWSSSGSRSAPWIVILAGVCGFVCVLFSVSALTLTTYGYPSQDDWLNADALKGTVIGLKEFRINVLWAEIDTKERGQKEKARLVIHAQIWLAAAAFYLLVLLFNLILWGSFRIGVWLESLIHSHNCIASWALSGNAAGALFLMSLPLVLFRCTWYSRSLFLGLFRRVVGWHGG